MGNVNIDFEGDIAWVSIDNPPVNATSKAVRQGLLSAVKSVQKARLAVLFCVGKTFIAGGDMSEFDHPPEEPHLPDVIDAIENSRTPFLALLHGNVLGGGFELAMACAFRIADPATRFGLPEVNVGLIPGAGGTQRAPRLVGWEAAVDMACSGRIIGATEAMKLGAIDAISDDLKTTARGFDRPPPKAVSKRAAPPLDPAWVAEKRKALAKKARNQRSPLQNLEALQWAVDDYSVGQPRERELHLKLRDSDQSRALRHAFFAERAVAKPKEIQGVVPRDLRKIVVVGGGLMGAGIAAACLGGGYSVTIIERDPKAAEAARERVVGMIGGALSRKKIDKAEHDRQVAAFSVCAAYEAAADVDLAIEAVFEDLHVKRQVFQRLAEIVPPEAILATNTSYLDPREIFADFSVPERCVGLHFFSPAHIMKLVEVVRLPESSLTTLATAFSLSRRLKKIAVMSDICDGFIGNRILAAYRRAAEYMLADGAFPENIDAAMRDFGMAMGPFETQDMSGLQIAEANRRRQDATRHANERYVGISDQLCDLGRFGQRTGKGWFAYEKGDRAPHADPEVTELIRAYSAAKGISRRPFDSDKIKIRLLAIMANEGALIVEEGIAESADAVDIVLLHGYGFPRWRGGPMHYAHNLGDDEIAGALEEVVKDSPGSWKIADKFRSTTT